MSQLPPPPQPTYVDIEIVPYKRNESTFRFNKVTYGLVDIGVETILVVNEGNTEHSFPVRNISSWSTHESVKKKKK